MTDQNRAAETTSPFIDSFVPDFAAFEGLRIDTDGSVLSAGDADAEGTHDVEMDEDVAKLLENLFCDGGWSFEYSLALEDLPAESLLTGLTFYSPQRCLADAANETHEKFFNLCTTYDLLPETAELTCIDYAMGEVVDADGVTVVSPEVIDTQD